MSDDLIKRLRAYNPPDRTVDEQRQISVDIHEAADALEAAQQRIAELERTSQYAYSIKRAIQEARLAGLREAQAEMPMYSAERDAIQALIDAATADPACKSPESDGPSSQG